MNTEGSSSTTAGDVRASGLRAWAAHHRIVTAALIGSLAFTGSSLAFAGSSLAFAQGLNTPIHTGSGTGVVAPIYVEPPRHPLPQPVVATPTPTPTTSAGGSYESQVVAQVNKERAKVGCNAVTVSSALTKAAVGHSKDMATNNYFSHIAPNGSFPGSRADAAGYDWQLISENIALGWKTPAAVMTAWMISSGQRANILNCSYRNIGVGLAYDGSGRPYWTQDFGKLR